jgi:hypothetical protein
LGYDDPRCGRTEPDDRSKARLPRPVPSCRFHLRVLGRSERSVGTSGKHPAAFNAHTPDGRGSGLVQYVLSRVGGQSIKDSNAAFSLRAISGRKARRRPVTETQKGELKPGRKIDSRSISRPPACAPSLTTQPRPSSRTTTGRSPPPASPRTPTPGAAYLALTR